MASGTRRFCGAALAVLMLGCGSPAATQAESTDTAALQQQLKALTEAVQRLEGRVRQLESGTAPATTEQAAAPAPAAPVPAAPTQTRLSAVAPVVAPVAAPTIARDPLRDHWHRIGRGMSTESVEALLGRPHRTIPVNTQTVWYYSYPDIGSGSVVFAEDGTVIDWQTPPFSTWW